MNRIPHSLDLRDVLAVQDSICIRVLCLSDLAIDTMSLTGSFGTNFAFNYARSYEARIAMSKLVKGSSNPLLDETPTLNVFIVTSHYVQR